MDEVQLFRNQFKNTTNEWTEQIVAWGNPDYPEAATKGWLLTSLDEALYVVAAYMVLVTIGLVMKFSGVPEEEKKKDEPAWYTSPLKIFIFMYNCVQVGLCGYMMAAATYVAYSKGYKLVCNAYDPTEASMASVLHVFYLSKVLDFCDTLFIIWRRKWRQLSFLHIYHHATIFMVYWLNINAGFDGDIYFTIVLNSFIHFTMYYYYVLTTLGQSPWWKKYITSLQLTQFVMMNVQAIYILMNGCAFPRNITIMYLGYIMSLFALFANFFRKNYGGGKKSSGKKNKKIE